MKNLLYACYLFVFQCLSNTVYAQDAATEQFLKPFPELKVGSTIGEKECKNALKNPITSSVIAKIDYKKLLYANAGNISQWVIMPIAKYKVADGIYYLMYFSSIMGANHTDTDCSYMLNLALIDFNKKIRIGENEGNDGEYIVMSDARKNSLIEVLGKNANVAIKANFNFTLNNNGNGTLKSTWNNMNGTQKNTSYDIYWDSQSFKIK